GRLSCHDRGTLRSNEAENGEKCDIDLLCECASHENSQKLVVVDSGAPDIAAATVSPFSISEERKSLDILSVGAPNQSPSSRAITPSNSCSQSQQRSGSPPAMATYLNPRDQAPNGAALPGNQELPSNDLCTDPLEPPVEPTFPEDVTSTPRFPLATLIVIMLQVQAHLNFLREDYPERCASVATVFREGRWERVATAAFHHGDVVHITANITSFFFKGLVIEAALGTKYFVGVLLIVIVLVGLVNVLLLRVVCAVAGTTQLETSCMHTLAGVALALELLHREYLRGSIIHLGKLVFRVRP
ncbi:hypothetical protein MRX96_056529, partial [Rhipicephalus microplus]